MDERWFGSKFQFFGATDENDLEVAMEVLHEGAHIDKDEEDRIDRTGAYRGMSTARSGASFQIFLGGAKNFLNFSMPPDY